VAEDSREEAYIEVLSFKLAVQASASVRTGEELDPKIMEELNRLTMGSVNLFYSSNCENKH
jgi:hypothetical protein